MRVIERFGGVRSPFALLLAALMVIAALAVSGWGVGAAAQDERGTRAEESEARKRKSKGGIVYVNKYTLRGPKNFLTGYEPENSDGTYNMAVEIPTGTSDKWEICTSAALEDSEAFPGCKKAGREMVHEVKEGKRRVLMHIGYPGNYGSIPKTKSGDGDPLDIVAIGPATKRGAVIAVKVVGLIRCVDDGEQDDKIVAITARSPLYKSVSTADELEAEAPKAADILLTFYNNYKGVDSGMVCDPMEDENSAKTVIDESHEAFTGP